MSFKGVFLEGLEVAFIVVTFGAAHDDFPLMIAAATAALVVVAIVGVIVHRPLSRVPENTMKFGVGLMLTTFGTFWGGEGAGAHWPGSDAAILVLLAVYAAIAFALVTWLRSRHAERLARIGASRMRRLRAFGQFWWDFVIGDDWRLALGGGLALALTALVARTSAAAWWIAPAVVITLLVVTLARAQPRAPH